MNSLTRRIIHAGTPLALSGVIALGASHVLGQTGYDSQIPPSPSGPSMIAAPTSAVAVPSKSSTAHPPYGYTRGRSVHSTQRSATPAPTHSTSSGKVKQVSAQAVMNSGVQQAIATTPPPPGWPSSTKAAGQNSWKGDVIPAGNPNQIHDPNIDPTLAPPPNIYHPPLFSRQGSVPSSGMTMPADRGVVPTIRGSHLGLMPGETATERSMRLMSTISDMERQLESLGQKNAEMTDLLKRRDDQLLVAIREIRSARKDVQTAKDELDHLRQQVKDLNEKIVSAERDNTALLQTMAPLLNQLLDKETASAATSP